MIGKANEIKTVLVVEQPGKPFDTTLNQELELLHGRLIIDIRFTATPDKEGVTWFNALIIHKEESA